MEKIDYWDKEIEPLLNTPKMRELQWSKLKQAIKYHYENVPFDRERMDKAGVKPEDIRSFEDFARSIPPVGQADFRTLIDESGEDMDIFFTKLFGEERHKDMYLLTTTSGTTGIPTPYPIFKKGIERQGDILARWYWRMGVRPGDRVAICFGLSMHAAGTPHLFWLNKVPGISLVPIGAEAGTERILKFTTASFLGWIVAVLRFFAFDADSLLLPGYAFSFPLCGLSCGQLWVVMHFP